MKEYVVKIAGNYPMELTVQAEDSGDAWKEALREHAKVQDEFDGYFSLIQCVDEITGA